MRRGFSPHSDSIGYYISGKPPTYALANYIGAPCQYLSYGLAIGQPERNTRIVRRTANVDGAWVVAIGRTWQEQS